VRAAALLAHRRLGSTVGAATTLQTSATYVTADAAAAAVAALNGASMTHHVRYSASVEFEPSDRPTSSMWGGVQHAKEYGPGVWSVSTADHGGFILSPARNVVVPECLRSDSGQYEEDCDWSAVAFTFPELFTQTDLEHAHNTLKHWRADEWEQLTGETLTPETSHQRAEEAFYAANAENWLVWSAFGDWAHWVPDGMVGVLARQGKPGSDLYNRSPARWFLVPEGEYGPRFVVNLASHAEIPAPANAGARKARAA
jgi:hypothetical protein